ncbi:MAG: 3-hydroxybutyryl-CoA dehydrogenase [Chloroflexi bacterium]|nr:3-hydroxybutyryl-CoA dehydrogenase [Chloroflexota bacterium]
MTYDLKPGVTTIGIIGAGTMGSGIALAALYAGYDVILQDPFGEATDQAKEYLSKFLEKKGMGEHMEKVTFSDDMEDLAPAHIVIEAVVEHLNLKKDIFNRLDVICPPPTILATNTSTLAVTEVAAAAGNPERVIGMHFFNPAPILKLVEVVKAGQTSQDVVDAVVGLAEYMQKTPVVTNDTPGFIVNRVARPFYGEALRLLGEGVATYEEIDTIVQYGGGFRMGPFQLMDLIGIDVNATAMQSMYEQSFGEPRYRPHWIQMQKMQATHLGRKTGSGFYDYNKDGEPERPQIPAAQAGNGQVVISKGNWAPGLKPLLQSAGYELHSIPQAADTRAAFIVARQKLRRRVELIDESLSPDVPMFVQTATAPLSEIAAWMQHPQRLVGLDGLFFAFGEVVSLITSPVMDETVHQRSDDFIRGLSKLPIWIKESPALVLPRIICQLVNEAAYAHLEGVAAADEIDMAMQLGVNYPFGPLAWGKQLGYRRVVAVLEHLYREYGEDRYRVCPLLRRWARLERTTV